LSISGPDMGKFVKKPEKSDLSVLPISVRMVWIAGPLNSPDFKKQELSMSATRRLVYYDQQTNMSFRGTKGLILRMHRLAARSMTYGEMAHELSSWGIKKAESGLTAAVNDLKNAGVLTDALPKRNCTVTGRMRKVWTLAHVPSTPPSSDAAANTAAASSCAAPSFAPKE
jgi:hypothetical protein